MQNPYLKSLELKPFTTRNLLKINRKNIFRKLHPDNIKTGNTDLFNTANQFYDMVTSSHQLNIQKRNLLTIGKSIKKEKSLEVNQMIYDLVKETGVKLSIAIFGFSVFNLVLLFLSYKLWAKILFLCISLVLLIVPIVASFTLKIMLMSMVDPMQFREQAWKDFLYYFHISYSIFPFFSLQELEFVVLHISVTWLVSLAISLPIKKDNLVKDLIETHRDVAKINRGHDGNVTEVFLKVKIFIEKYRTPSYWQRIKKCFNFIIPVLFIFVLPYIFKEK